MSNHHNRPFYHSSFSIGQLGKCHVDLTGSVSVIFSMSFLGKQLLVLSLNSIEISSALSHFLYDLLSLAHIHTPSLAAKISVLQKTGLKTFHEVFNHHDLDCEHNNPIFHKSLQIMMMYHQITSDCRRIEQHWIYTAGMIILDYINPHSDLDTDHSKTIFSKTLWLMMMHHHTKFGHKR